MAEFIDVRLCSLWTAKASCQRSYVHSYNDGQEVTARWFRQQPNEFCADGIHRLARPWDSCL